MKEYKEQLEAQYDAQVEVWEDYKQKFEDMVNAYEEQQTRQLAIQLGAIKDEKDNWLTRLDNLANFVSEYNKIQAQLDTGNTSVSNTATGKDATGGGSYKGNGGSTSKANQFVNTRTTTSSKASSFVDSI